MQYSTRSGSKMDSVSAIFPIALRGVHPDQVTITRPPDAVYLPGFAAGGGSGESGLGRLHGLGDDSSGMDFGTDASPSFFDPVPGSGDVATPIGPDNTGVPAYAAPPAAGSQTSWLDSIKAVIAPAKDIYVAQQSAAAQANLIAVNTARAKAGLPLLPAGALAPQANIGLSTDTMTLIRNVAIGFAVTLALTALIKRGRKSR